MLFEVVYYIQYMCLLFCFFKHKTAYDRRSSDWSSEVCYSDLNGFLGQRYDFQGHATVLIAPSRTERRQETQDGLGQIGRPVGQRGVRNVDGGHTDRQGVV